MQAIGRYQVSGKIGAGNQGSVYRCEDPGLKRQVAIKLLHKNLLGADADSEAFAREAEALGRFQHPNIVSVYDVGQHQGQPYIVFEYVEGELLSQRIAGGQLKLPAILDLVEGIAAGVAKAHEAGVVHRDLKPQNIIINAEGMPKIMDFGIAMLVQDEATSEQLVGTPRYMAPEYIRQRVVKPTIDVFAIGAIFYEMLTGAPAFAGKSTADVVARILIGPPRRPSTVNTLADEQVDGICLKALAANPGDRYQDAGKLRQALHEYLQAQQPAIKVEGQGNSTLNFLYRRMQRRQDFPALADSIRAINQLQTTSKKDAEKLAAIIVNDFALTNKILRVVNSAFYGSFAGKISTISRAIVVLGVYTVRSIAASLIFFEHMSSQVSATRLKQLMATSLFRAILAEEITAAAELDGLEEAFLCAMFQQLGVALVAYYLPDEDQEIQRLLAASDIEPNQAARQVLDVSFDEVGEFVAQQWNFPPLIISAMQPETEDVAGPDEEEAQRYRLVTCLADQVTSRLTQGAEEGELERQMQAYRKQLPLKNVTLAPLVEKARQNFSVMADKLLSGNPGDLTLQRLGARQPQPDPATPGASGFSLDAALGGADNQPDIAMDAESILSQGLQEATAILLETGDVSQVFNTVLETLYRALGFRRVILSLLKDGTFSGRMGFGDHSRDLLKSFRFVLDSQRNLFNVSLRKGVDVYIADINDRKIRHDLPDWFTEQTDASSFALFPLQLNGRPIGFIYGEFAAPGQLQIDSRSFNLVKSLRNQMMLALRQH